MAASRSSLRLLFRTANTLKYSCHFCSKSLSGRRTFLSAAFKCDDAWNKRLSEPVVKTIKPGDYYGELYTRFQSEKRISAIDLNLFANSICTDSLLDELRDIVHRFRRTPDTIYALPSTCHAVIRTYIQFGQYDTLLQMLNDRLNYGLFPDHYCYSLMMDTFLKQKNHRDAARVATLMMLQEDFSHPLSKHLALYSCLAYLWDPLPDTWKPPPPPTPEEEPAEQVIIRLSYLPPKYFDDHFDLTDPTKLLGKTLTMLGRQFEDHEVGNTCQLIGYTMHEKWEKLHQLLTQLLETKESVYEEGVTKVKEHLANTSSEEDAKIIEERINKITTLLDQLQLKVGGNLLETVRSKLVDVIKNSEKQTIDEQLNVYEKWAQDRQREVERQVQSYVRRARMKKLQEVKEDLKNRERLIYFFDNFEKHAMKAEEYDKVAETVAAEEKSKEDDSTYIPPEVQKRRVTKK